MSKLILTESWTDDGRACFNLYQESVNIGTQFIAEFNPCHKRFAERLIAADDLYKALTEVTEIFVKEALPDCVFEALAKANRE